MYMFIHVPDISASVILIVSTDKKQKSLTVRIARKGMFYILGRLSGVPSDQYGKRVQDAGSQTRLLRHD